MRITDQEISDALTDALMAFDADQRSALGIEPTDAVTRGDKIVRRVDAMACVSTVRKLIGQAAK